MPENEQGNENVTLDANHPYVKALLSGSVPLPTNFNFIVDEVQYTDNDGIEVKFARCAFASTNGVFVFHANEQFMMGVIQGFTGLLQKWKMEEQAGLVVADTIDLQQFLKEHNKNGTQPRN